MVAVQNYNRIRASLDILKDLNDEYSSIVCSDHDTWEIGRNIEGLIGDFLVGVEEAMLPACKIIFDDERANIEHGKGFFGILGAKELNLSLGHRDRILNLLFARVCVDDS